MYALPLDGWIPFCAIQCEGCDVFVPVCPAIVKVSVLPEQIVFWLTLATMVGVG
jgi:hypothetical protein